MIAQITMLILYYQPILQYKSTSHGFMKTILQKISLDCFMGQNVD